MANSSAFNTTGALPKKVTQSSYSPFGNTSSGIIGTINRATGLSPAPVTQGTNPGVIKPPNMTPYVGSYAQQQAQPQAPQPSTAIKKVVTPDGTATEYHKPDVPVTPSTPPAPNPSAPQGNVNAPVGATVGTQIQNVANTGQQTQNEAATQKAVQEAGAMTQWEQDVKNGMAVEEANKRLTDLRMKIQEAYAGVENQAIPLEFQQGQQQVLARQFAGQEAAAQSGVSNALQAQGQQFGAAQAQAGRGATQAQAAYQGAQQQAGRFTGAQEAVLGAVAPQGYAPTTTPYQPGTNTFGGMAAGPGGATTAGIIQGQAQAGQMYAMNSAVLGKVNAELPGLKQAMKDDNFNPSNITYLNQIGQWAKGTLSDSSIPKVQGSLNNIVSALSGVLGVPSSAGSDFRIQFAGSIVNSLQKGSSIDDAITFAVNQATASNQGYLQGAQGALGGATGTGTVQSQVVSGNYVLENGKWVYKQ